MSKTDRVKTATQEPIVPYGLVLNTAECDLVCEALRMMVGQLLQCKRTVDATLPGSNMAELCDRWAEQATDLRERLQS